jgi:GTP 3',8-cyclase
LKKDIDKQYNFLDVLFFMKEFYRNVLLRDYNPHLISYFNGQNPPPYEIEIQPSSKCNANCTHCWAKNFPKLENKLETKENADLIINKILNFKQNGFPLPRIKFCGSTGEPLMNPIIDYIIERFYGDREIRLFTNGIKIGEEKNNQEYLDSLSKLNSLYLSLDAGTTETLWKIKSGAKTRNVKIEDILEGTKKIRESGNTDIYSSYVITEKNYGEISEATKKIKEYGLGYIRFRIDLTDRNLSKDKSSEIIYELNKAKSYEDENLKVVAVHSDEEIGETNQDCFNSKGLGLKCYTNRFWTCIGSNGRIYPCGHIVSPETEDYGSLFEQSFQEIWNGEKIKQAREKTPGKLCEICSPFSLTTNILIDSMLKLPKKDLFNILEEKRAQKFN